MAIYIASIRSICKETGYSSVQDYEVVANTIDEALDTAEFMAQAQDGLLERVRNRVMHNHVAPNKIVSEVK